MKIIEKLKLYNKAPRPYVAFAATDHRQALYLYRSQNLIWIWLGMASILSASTYFDRPHLGVVLASKYVLLDIIREVLFAIGGTLISIGVWKIRRSVEVVGHIFFATGAFLNAIATLTIRHIVLGNHIVSIMTLLGISAASAFRAYFIVKWIGAEQYVSNAGSEH